MPHPTPTGATTMAVNFTNDDAAMYARTAALAMRTARSCKFGNFPTTPSDVRYHRNPRRASSVLNFNLLRADTIT